MLGAIFKMNEQKRKNLIAVAVLVVVALTFYLGSFIFLTSK